MALPFTNLLEASASVLKTEDPRPWHLAFGICYLPNHPAESKCPPRMSAQNDEQQQPGMCL